MFVFRKSVRKVSVLVGRSGIWLGNVFGNKDKGNLDPNDDQELIDNNKNRISSSCLRSSSYSFRFRYSASM